MIHRCKLVQARLIIASQGRAGISIKQDVSCVKQIAQRIIRFDPMRRDVAVTHTEVNQNVMRKDL